MYVENQAKGYSDWNNILNGGPMFIDYRKFALDLNDPSMLLNHDMYQESFLKSK
jgi:hypothetical protein